MLSLGTGRSWLFWCRWVMHRWGVSIGDKLRVLLALLCLLSFMQLTKSRHLNAAGVIWRDGQLTSAVVPHCCRATLLSNVCRWHDRLYSSSCLRHTCIDTLMLDTTYALPKHTFPPQEEAVSMMAQVRHGDSCFMVAKVSWMFGALLHHTQRFQAMLCNATVVSLFAVSCVAVLLHGRGYC